MKSIFKIMIVFLMITALIGGWWIIRNYLYKLPPDGRTGEITIQKCRLIYSDNNYVYVGKAASEQEAIAKVKEKLSSIDAKKLLPDRNGDATGLLLNESRATYRTSAEQYSNDRYRDGWYIDIGWYETPNLKVCCDQLFISDDGKLMPYTTTPCQQ